MEPLRSNIAAILNPTSGGGAAARIWHRVREYLPADVQVYRTSAPGHAIQLTVSALKAGAQTIVAVGGDGTIHETINGFFADERPISPQAVLGIIPAGTGSDLRRSLRLPLDVGEAALMIANGLARPVDLMRVRYTSHNGLPSTRFAINVTSFGMGGVVAARSHWLSKWLGGKAPFLIATMLTAAWHAGSRVTLVFDRMDPIEARVTNVVIGNGQYQGAGMWVCPDAKLDDGQLDVTVIRYLNGFEIVRDIRMLYDGKILEHPKVSSYRVRHIRAASPDTTFVEIDGEPLGRLPLEIEVIPSAIRVVTGVIEGDEKESQCP